MAGVLPQIAVYIGMLWAALAASDSPHVDGKLVARPFKWFRKLCADKLQTAE